MSKSKNYDDEANAWHTAASTETDQMQRTNSNILTAANARRTIRALSTFGRISDRELKFFAEEYLQ